MSDSPIIKAEDLAEALAPTDPRRLTPERRQQLALAVLASPVLPHGTLPSRAMRDAVDVAGAVATLEGVDSVMQWANDTFRTRGVKRRGGHQ